MARAETKAQDLLARALAAEELSLADIQAQFQAAIVSGDEAVLARLCDNSRTGRTTLFGVYRNAYAARLVEMIANDHEHLKAYLGEEAFEEMARAYIARNPSHTPNARWFSRGVPAFLATTEPWSGHPQLAELAGIEAALANAFDAPDGPAIGLPGLAAIPPERWPELTFAQHPSAERMRLATNAFPIWQALKSEGEPPAPVHLIEPQPIIVWRREVTPMIREMAAEEAMMWDEACKGVRFAHLCEMLATYDDPDGAPARAASYLAGWLGAGLLSGVSEKAVGKKRGK